MPTTSRRPERRFGRRAARLGLAAPLFAAGCVTVETDAPATLPPLAAAVSMPLGSPGASGDPHLQVLDAYYASVVTQLRDAVLERQPERLAELLATHDRPFAPEWAKAQLAMFHPLVRVLEFEAHAARSASLSVVGETPPLGALVPLALRVPELRVHGLVVPGADAGDGAARVQVEVRVVDEDCFGGNTQREFGEILPLERSVRVHEGEAVEAYFAVPELAPAGCRRSVELRCTLLPGSFVLDGERVPNQSVALGSWRFGCHPLGFDRLRDAALDHLRRGLELGRPEHFDHVFLAAATMPEQDREAAIRLLIAGLRDSGPTAIGTARARNCAASLRELTGIRLPVADREAWLSWAERWEAEKSEQPRRH